jgi:uncharacterized protein YprB with RNaseH-like and TPR domain
MTNQNLQKIINAKPDFTRLELILPGEIIPAGKGELYLIRQDIKKLCYDADDLGKKYRNIFDQAIDHNKLNNDFKSILNMDPKEIVFLDIETTGLSNTPLFLIGLLYFDGDNLVIDQLFARDYSEESNLLHYFSEFAPKFNVLMTFNGKSFDMPFIRDRMIFHRKFAKWTYTHVDVLHHSRKRWKGAVPDCKLQTLEYHICQRRRVDDIPGALVPEVYHDFVRNGNPEYLAGVFHHNALDLITLFELTTVLITMESD